MEWGTRLRWNCECNSNEEGKTSMVKWWIPSEVKYTIEYAIRGIFSGHKYTWEGVEHSLALLPYLSAIGRVRSLPFLVCGLSLPPSLFPLMETDDKEARPKPFFSWRPKKVNQFSQLFTGVSNLSNIIKWATNTVLYKRGRAQFVIGMARDRKTLTSVL